MTHAVGHLTRAGPDGLEKNRLPVAPGTERLVVQVKVECPREGIGDHQRRGGQEIHLDVPMDAAVEVAVAPQGRPTDHLCPADAPAQLPAYPARIAAGGGAAQTAP